MRRLLRHVVPLAFLISAVTAATLTIPALGIGGPQFVHRYAKDPAHAGEVAVGAPMTPVPRYDIVTGVTVTSLHVLSEALPSGTLTHIGAAWTLHRPVVAASRAHLMLRGPGSLTLASGSYLEVGPGGSATLSNLTISGAPSASDRAFLLAAGGRLLLDHDAVDHLGRLATLAYGISFAGAASGSGVENCLVTGNLTGVYVTATNGVQITHNRIVSSVVDGVDLSGNVSGVSVSGNDITHSGLHDIVLAGRVTASVVNANALGPAAEHGVLLYNGPSHDRITGNSFQGMLDGIVVNQSSSNSFTGNTVLGVRRFGVRVTGLSRHNVVASNHLEGCAIGIYVLDRATLNQFVSNHFSVNGENVRIRLTAPGNLVRPAPPASELRSA